MAIVKTTKMYIPRRGGSYEFIRKTNCDSEGRFSIKLPEEWHETLGYAHVYAESLEKVETAFDKAQKDFTDANTTTLKVILYKIECAADIREGKGENSRHLYDTHQVHFHNGAAIDFGAGVYEEQTVHKPSGDCTYKYIFAESSIPLQPHMLDLKPHTGWQRAENQMPWTKERERFFAYISTAMHKLIMQLSEFEDKDKLLDCIDSGRLLTEGGT